MFVSKATFRLPFCIKEYSLYLHSYIMGVAELEGQGGGGGGA